MEIAIGTAQFGLPYGIANKNQQVEISAVEEILKVAVEKNILMLDTAVAYGTSEQVLGNVGVQEFDVISKLAPITGNVSDYGMWVSESVEGSLSRLNISSLYGYLLHRPMELFSSNGETIFNSLIDLKSKGLIKKIGVSVYGPEEVELLSKHYDFDLIQFPLNIFDRRMHDSGWMKKLKEKGVELHIRSAFLQGLLLMSAHERNLYFNQWGDLFDRYDLWLKEVELSPLQACIGFLNGISEIDRLVVGLNSVNHLKEIVEASKVTIEVPDSIKSEDANLINPGCWSI